MTTRTRRFSLPVGIAPGFVAVAAVLAISLVLGFSPSPNPWSLLTGAAFEREVPKVAGQTQVRALVELRRKGLQGRVSFVYSAGFSRGVVISQDPKAGHRQDEDDPVRLIVSRGANQVSVPDVVGSPEEIARKQLGALALRPRIERVNDEDVAAGIIMRQVPEPATIMSGGDHIELVISLGPAQRHVPQVAGIALEGALFNLGKAGLSLGTVSRADNPLIVAGAVISTDPPADSVIARDAAVNVLVSNGPPPVGVPNLVDGTFAAASEQLAKIGLVAGEISSYGLPGDPEDGKVLSQSPAAGTSLRKGQVVTLTVKRAALPATTTTVAPPPPAPPPPTTKPPGTR